MPQDHAFVNCPYCPTTFPVIAPDLNRRIRSVQATKLWITAHGARNNSVACPNCHRRCWLSWTYEPALPSALVVTTPLQVRALRFPFLTASRTPDTPRPPETRPGLER